MAVLTPMATAVAAEDEGAELAELMATFDDADEGVDNGALILVFCEWIELYVFSYLIAII